jgi:hypothetical protein
MPIWFRKCLFPLYLKRPYVWNDFTLNVLDISLCPFYSPERRQTEFPLIPAT